MITGARGWLSDQWSLDGRMESRCVRRSAGYATPARTRYVCIGDGMSAVVDLEWAL